MRISHSGHAHAIQLVAIHCMPFTPRVMRDICIFRNNTRHVRRNTRAPRQTLQTSPTAEQGTLRAPGMSVTPTEARKASFNPMAQQHLLRLPCAVPGCRRGPMQGNAPRRTAYCACSLFFWNVLPYPRGVYDHFCPKKRIKNFCPGHYFFRNRVVNGNRKGSGAQGHAK